MVEFPFDWFHRSTEYRAAHSQPISVYQHQSIRFQHFPRSCVFPLKRGNVDAVRLIGAHVRDIISSGKLPSPREWGDLSLRGWQKRLLLLRLMMRRQESSVSIPGFPSQRRWYATSKTFNHTARKCDAREGAKNLSRMLIRGSIRGIPPFIEGGRL